MSSTNNVTYRKADADDIPQLVDCRIQQLVDEGYPEIRDIRAELAHYFAVGLADGSLICWVAVVDGNIAGTSGLCFYQLPPTFSNPTGRIAYITNMYTRVPHRRQGISSRLLNLLVEEAKALNFPSVRLHASELGKGVYERAGFTDLDGYMYQPL